MHRDLKPENILISLDNINMDNNAIKIADFGTAKEVPKYKNDSLTDYICTRWYRAPECVLKSKNYDEKIDIWALGCIMAELYNLKPLFPGQSAFDQINKIVYVLGTPSYEDWPEGYRLMQDLNMKFPENVKKNFRNNFYEICDEAVDFLEFIFQYNPMKRPSAKELLNHPYLKNKLNLSKIRMNSYSSQSSKNNYVPIKERLFSNSSINTQAPYNYNKMFLNENNDRNNNNNQISSPTFFIPQVKNKSINIIPSRFDEEDSFFNKKPCGRSKSSVIEQRKYNNINENNNFNIIRDAKPRNNNFNFSDIGNENKELDEINKLLDRNILDMQNKYDGIYNNRSKNVYMPFKNDYNTNNNAFSSIAKNDIVQNNQFLFNRYIDKRKETINNMDHFHNIAPKIKRYTSNRNNYMFNENKNIGINANPIDKYRSFFATRYNL
jgi:serine/threonine protein kinase